MAFWFGILVWGLTIASVVVLCMGIGTAPEAISQAGRDIDAQFYLTLAITGVVFVLAQALLGYYAMKYKAERPGGVVYIHGNNKIEGGGSILIGVIFVALAILGQRAWANLHLTDIPGAMQIQVTGEQFAWNVRYAGKDGLFGRSSPRLFNTASGNPLGLDYNDPAAKDDVVSPGELVVPVNTPIELRLRSKDVLHDWFMPALRIKQDTVPGLEIPLRFAAEKTGQYEVLCAELCGLGHYTMKALLTVMEPDAFARWLEQESTAQAQSRP